MQATLPNDENATGSKKSWAVDLIHLNRSLSDEVRADIIQKLESVCLGEGMSLVRMPPVWAREFLNQSSTVQARRLTECVEQSKNEGMHSMSEPFAAVVLGEQKRGMQTDQELCILVGGGTGCDFANIKQIINTAENGSTVVSTLSAESKQASFASRAARSNLVVQIAEECCGASKSNTAESLSMVDTNTICDSCHTQCTAVGETSIQVTSRCVSGTNTWGNVLVMGNTSTHGVDIVASTDKNSLQATFPDMTYYVPKLRPEDKQTTENVDTNTHLVANAIIAANNPCDVRFARWHLSKDAVQWQNENLINMHCFEDNNPIHDMDIVAHYNIISMAISNPDPKRQDLKIAMQKNSNAEIFVTPNEEMLQLMTQAAGGLSVAFAASWAAQTPGPQGPRMHLNANHMNILKTYIQKKHQNTIDAIMRQH